MHRWGCDGNIHTHIAHMYVRLRIIMRTRAKRARDISNLLLPCWQPRRRCFASNERVISSPPPPTFANTHFRRLSTVVPRRELRDLARPASPCASSPSRSRLLGRSKVSGASRFSAEIVRSYPSGRRIPAFQPLGVRRRPFPSWKLAARSTTGKFHCFFLFSSFVLWGNTVLRFYLCSVLRDASVRGTLKPRRFIRDFLPTSRQRFINVSSSERDANSALFGVSENAATKLENCTRSIASKSQRR